MRVKEGKIQLPGMVSQFFMCKSDNKWLLTS